MKKKQNKGITLIALIITIIVLLILAGVAINTLTGENGILKQAEKAKTDTTIGEEKEAIRLAYNGAKIDKLGKSVTAADLNSQFLTNGTKAEASGTDKIKIEFETGRSYTIDGKGNIREVEVSLEHKDIIPEGGTYYVGVTATATGNYTGATATYTAGNEFPQPSTGDVYVYGDYEYKYNYTYGNKGANWQRNIDLQGWGVHVLDNTKTSYGDILVSINNANIKSMEYTFVSCRALTVAPIIPDTVELLTAAFWNCESLITAPVIPINVRKVAGAFQNCTNLTGEIEVNSNQISEFYAFLHNCNVDNITITGTCSDETKTKLLSAESVEEAFNPIYRPF